jgi:hypothetical protein
MKDIYNKTETPNNMQKNFSEQNGLKESFKKCSLKAKTQIAKNLIGIIDDKIISAKTGLSIEEIKALKREH